MSIRLPKSAKVVLARLTIDGPMTPKDISDRVDLAPRTVSFALRKLIKEDLCHRIPNLTDMRCPYYRSNMNRVRELNLLFSIDTYYRLKPSTVGVDSSRSFNR
ncbi:MAG: MarR family transcriptional regulator [Candidatus Thorarchaeota archaeon]|jgi:DNA-binding MarR family transcriptional regulator